jgi:hypothetical protein
MDYKIVKKNSQLYDVHHLGYELFYDIDHPGWIYNNEKELVCRSFEHTPEIEYTPELVMKDTEWDFFASVEGTLLRIFYDKERWFCSTKKQIDVFRPCGTKQTIGNKLQEILDISFLEFCEELDKNYIHTFILSYDRWVCKPHNCLYYTGSFTRDGIHTWLYTTSLPTFETIHTIINPLEYQGIICINKMTNKIIKVLSSEYICLKHIRGTNTLMERYLSLRGSPMVSELEELYPEYSVYFETIEKGMLELAHKLHVLYMKRYVNKWYVDVSNEYLCVLQECHRKYRAKECEKVTYGEVLNVLSNQSVSNLKTMLKEFKIEFIF